MRSNSKRAIQWLFWGLLVALLLLSRKPSWESQHCGHGEVAVDTDGIAGVDTCMLR